MRILQRYRYERGRNIMTNKHDKLIDEIIICLNRIDSGNYTYEDLKTCYYNCSKIQEDINEKHKKGGKQ